MFLKKKLNEFLKNSRIFWKTQAKFVKKLKKSESPLTSSAANALKKPWFSKWKSDTKAKKSKAPARVPQMPARGVDITFF